MYNYTTKKIGLLLGLCILGSGTSQALQVSDYITQKIVKEQEQTSIVALQTSSDFVYSSIEKAEELNQFALFNGPQDYCEVTVGYGVNPITRVQFADLNHQTDIEPNALQTALPYEDFTGLTAHVQRGETYTLVVEGNTDGNYQHDIHVFIDWNNDGVFDVNTELYRALLEPSTGQDGVNVTFQIRVPEDAVQGTTRMRIIKDNWFIYEDGDFDACTNPEYGQIEDYSVEISDAGAGSEYCQPEISAVARSLPIYEMTFGETTKTSGSNTTTAPLYEDFTSVVLPVQKGGTYPLAVKGKTDGQDMLLVKVYIDYNRDFIFSEEEASTIGFLRNIGDERGEVSGTIQIPLDALVGATRMRVVSMYHNPETTWVHLENVPCPEGYYLGQVEDYTLDIQLAPLRITAVEVSTENSVPAEITIENGTLQLVAHVLPAEAHQAVTWSIVQGGDWASIDSNGRVTAIENGTIKVKATSVQDETKSAEIEVVIAIESLRCPPINTIKVEEIGEETARLHIESNASVFEIEYGPVGFEQGQGTRIEQASSVQQIQGLTAEVSYDVYVRVAADCSTWKKINFTTIRVKEQVISIEDAHKVYGDAPFQPGQSTSQLPLIYTVVDSAIARVENGTLVIKGAGQTEVRVNQPGNNEYLPAAEVHFILHVAQAPLLVQPTNQTKVYDGSIPNTWTVTYQGFVYDEEESVLDGTLQYEGSALQAIDVGTYRIAVRGYTSPNYEIQYQEGILTIAKATLEGIRMEDGVFLYDGDPKSLVLTPNELPEGVTVTYEGNEQIEVGDYTVKALLHGGVNYEDKRIEANLKIRHPLSNLVFEDATFMYDGTAKQLVVVGAPEGVTITYYENEQTEVGRYTVTAIISGNEQYEDLVLRATMVIVKATIEDVAFESRTFTYDGTAKSIFVSGALPQGVTVQHLNNGKIDVGSYEVKAKILGGTNYHNRELTATLIIEKANQTIVFDELSTLILDESEDFQLQASATSGLPLHYAYTYMESQPAAEVSATGWVTRKKVGQITITITQEGNQNYHPATPSSRVLHIVNNDATIHDIWIENEQYTAPQKKIYHLMSCADLRTEVPIKITLAEGAKIEPSTTFNLSVPKPGVYRQTVAVVSQDGKVKQEYVIIVEKPFAFDQIAVQKFNNTLLINKNPQTNGGYHLVGFQWFKNGELLSENQVYSAGAMTILDPKGEYHALVKTADGEEIHVCPMQEVAATEQVIRWYPNPVVLGQPTTLEVRVTGVQVRGIPVQVFNLNGQVVHTFSLEGERTAVHLPQTIQGGMYVAVFELNGKRKSIKMAVKK